MVQRWHDLLFAHWRVAIDELRPFIPAPLEIDTFDGAAWIGVVPFYMSGVRMRGAPPVPTTHAFPEINVRTYVHLDGHPGVWFFSLDCPSTLAVIGARVGAHLPYFRATVRMQTKGNAVAYLSKRWGIAGTPAVFDGEYAPAGDDVIAAPGTLDHFLTERYALFASSGRRLWRGDIMHERWRLHPARARVDRNSMIAAAGIRHIAGEPLLHYARFQDVRLWWPQRVR